MKLVCLRGNHELFQAQGSIIKLSIINNPSNNNNYLLNLPFLSKPINQLLLNTSQNLLIVDCLTELYCISLSSNYLSKINKKTILSNESLKLLDLEYNQIGSFIFNETCLIQKILWNPVAKHDATLVVLTNDNVIRSFDLSISFQQPFQTINLSNTDSNNNNEKSFSMVAVEGIQKAVSMTFGSNDKSKHPQGCLTLYVFTKEGDLYSLYPFIPRELSISQDFFDTLFNESIVHYKFIENEIDQIENHDDEEDELNKLYTDKDSSLNQLQWIRYLQNNVSKEKEFVKNKQGKIIEYNIINLDELINDKVCAIQGPLEFHNPISKIENNCNLNGEDIININENEVNFLQLVFNTGDLLLIYPNPRNLMKWKDDSDDFSIPNGDILKLVEISKNFKRVELFTIDGKYFMVGYTNSLNYLIQIDYENYSKELNYLLNENPENHNFIKKNITLNTLLKINEKIMGVELINNNLVYKIKDELVYLKSPNTEKIDKIINFPKNENFIPNIEFKYHEKSFLKTTLILENFVQKLERYKIIQQNSLSYLTTNKKFDKSLKIGEIEQIHIDLLNIMELISKEFIKNIGNLLDYQILFNKSLNGLKIELEYQIKKILEIFAKVDNFKNEKHLRDFERFKKIKQRQVVINNRLSTLKDKLINNEKNLPLNKEEKKFLQDLTKIEKIKEEFTINEKKIMLQNQFFKNFVNTQNNISLKNLSNDQINYLQLKLNNFEKVIKFVEDTILQTKNEL